MTVPQMPLLQFIKYRKIIDTLLYNRKGFLKLDIKADS